MSQIGNKTEDNLENLRMNVIKRLLTKQVFIVDEIQQVIPYLLDLCTRHDGFYNSRSCKGNMNVNLDIVSNAVMNLSTIIQYNCVICERKRIFEILIRLTEHQSMEIMKGAIECLMYFAENNDISPKELRAVMIVIVKILFGDPTNKFSECMKLHSIQALAAIAEYDMIPELQSREILKAMVEISQSNDFTIRFKKYAIRAVGGFVQYLSSESASKVYKAILNYLKTSGMSRSNVLTRNLYVWTLTRLIKYRFLSNNDVKLVTTLMMDYINSTYKDAMSIRCLAQTLLSDYLEDNNLQWEVISKLQNMFTMKIHDKDSNITIDTKRALTALFCSFQHVISKPSTSQDMKISLICSVLDNYHDDWYDYDYEKNNNKRGNKDKSKNNHKSMNKYGNNDDNLTKKDVTDKFYESVRGIIINNNENNNNSTIVPGKRIDILIKVVNNKSNYMKQETVILLSKMIRDNQIPINYTNLEVILYGLFYHFTNKDNIIRINSFHGFVYLLRDISDCKYDLRLNCDILKSFRNKLLKMLVIGDDHDDDNDDDDDKSGDKSDNDDDLGSSRKLWCSYGIAIITKVMCKEYGIHLISFKVDKRFYSYYDYHSNYC